LKGPTRNAERLLSEYVPVVRQIAAGFQRRLPCSVLRDDLVAAGMTGLWDAIQKQGDEPSPSFEWYVRVRIRGAILDELRAQDWLPRRARASALAAQKAGDPGRSAPVVLRLDEVSVTEQARFLVTSRGGEADRDVEEREARAKLEEAVALLPERERHIVAMHYFEGVKFKELGRLLGVSEPRISQLHSRALSRLRTLMERAA
jgi:RNA polymerase sigma factor for flagellar operon FliA